jgi:hypothetical protein
MLRILLVGDLNSVYVSGYATELKDHFREMIELDILATFPVREGKRIPVFNKIISPQTSGTGALSDWTRKIRRPWLLKKFLRDRRHVYQIIHVLYCIQDLMIVGKALRKATPRLILTVFGSDFMQLDGWKHRFMRKVYVSADFITTNNTQSIEKIRTTYGIPGSRMKLCRFGFSNLNEIRKLQGISKQESRRQLGIPGDKTVVCIGYNYDPIQQHLPVLQSIIENNSLMSMQEKLFFIIPMTYGTDAAYRCKLLQALQNFPFRHMTIEQFLSTEDLAHLRRATDILVQVQQSDSFSASTQEHMFAGNLLITGKWLPYGDLEQAGIYFRNIGGAEEAGAELSWCLGNLESELEKCRANSDSIYMLSSWESNIGSWADLYHP